MSNVINHPIPFDSQIFIDATRTKWQFDGSVKCWRKIGPVPEIPPASEVMSGLLTAAFKRMLDGIPEKGGAFGIVVKPFLSLKSATNPDGVIVGDVDFVSDSLNIGCVGLDGKPLKKPCTECAPEDGKRFPAITFKLSEEFLKTLCIEITTAPGPKGGKGDKGDRGKDGTGDGPTGEQGDPGVDADGEVRFAGIEVQESDDVFDTAVTDLEVDQASGRLAATKAKMRVPDNDTPATQLITTQIERSIQFGQGFSFEILMPPNDPIGSPDITLLSYPQGSGGNQTKTVVNAVKLRAFIQRVIDDYAKRLVQIDADYSKALKGFVVEKDAAARDALNSMACNLTEAEWQAPLENCLGLMPNDCHPDDGQPESVQMELAGEIFGPPFCPNSKAEDLGTYDIPAGAGVTSPPVSVMFPQRHGGFGSATLPTGAYLCVYADGTLSDRSRPDVGSFVGRPEAQFGLEMKAASGIVKFPSLVNASNECAPGMDITDARSVEIAYRQADINFKSMKAILDEAGHIQLTARGTHGFVRVKVFRVTQCPAGSVQFTLPNYDATPGSPVTLTVVREAGDAGACAINFATSDGTAVAGTDYTAASGTLSFVDGETTKQITVSILPGGAGTSEKTFTVTLNNPVSVDLGGTVTATVTIKDTVP
jgi:hypothetical protein